MLRPSCRFLGLILGLLLCGGCGITGGSIKPRGSASLTLDAAQKLTAVNVKFEYLLTITLPPAGPGQEWQIAFHDPRYLKLVHDIRPGTAPGAGPEVAVISLSHGRTRLRFVLLPRAAGREAVPLDQQDLGVTIQ